MTFRLSALALAVSLVGLTARAQDHPFKSVAKDDFATYKMKVSVGALNLEGTTTQTVTDKNDKEATVQVKASFGGMETPPQEQKIDLTKPYDPTRVGVLPPGAKTPDVKKLKTGEETIKAGKGKDNKDRTYKCNWTTYQIEAEAGGQKISGQIKVWESAEVRMGLVRMEMTGKVTSAADATQTVDTKLTLELIDHGTRTPGQ